MGACQRLGLQTPLLRRRNTRWHEEELGDIRTVARHQFKKFDLASLSILNPSNTHQEHSRSTLHHDLTVRNTRPSIRPSPSDLADKSFILVSRREPLHQHNPRIAQQAFPPNLSACIAQDPLSPPSSHPEPIYERPDGTYCCCPTD